MKMRVSAAQYNMIARLHDDIKHTRKLKTGYIIVFSLMFKDLPWMTAKDLFISHDTESKVWIEETLADAGITEYQYIHLEQSEIFLSRPRGFYKAIFLNNNEDFNLLRLTCTNIFHTLDIENARAAPFK